MKRRMRYITWCKKDTNDERKINYTLKTYDGKILKFTSDEAQPFSILERLRYAWIESIKLINGEWNAVLYED